MVIETIKNPLIVSLFLYVIILIVIFLSNISEQFGREKHMLFYYIVSIIVPILIYLFVMVVIF